MTCLAGDVIGDYSFEHPVAIGDRLVFEDMAIYSMVKNNTFNGMPLPGIALLKEDGTVEMIKTFGYEDFKERDCHNTQNILRDHQILQRVFDICRNTRRKTGDRKTWTAEKDNKSCRNKKDSAGAGRVPYARGI